MSLLLHVKWLIDPVHLRMLRTVTLTGQVVVRWREAGVICIVVELLTIGDQLGLLFADNVRILHTIVESNIDLEL